MDELIHRRLFGGGDGESVPRYSTDETLLGKVRNRIRIRHGHRVVTGTTQTRPKRWFARYETDPSTATEVLAETENLAVCRLAIHLSQRG